MDTIDSYAKLRDELERNADGKYRDFTMKICTSKHPFLGVRVPQIRKCAKRVPSEKIEEFIAVRPSTYEEVLLRGFLIARLPYPRMVECFDSQLRYIDDWSTCDLFCSAISGLVGKNKEDFLGKKIAKLLDDGREFGDRHEVDDECEPDDGREFYVRVGLVILKCCYVEPDYLAYIFTEADRLSGCEEYYVKMGIAWLVSECFIKFPLGTMKYLSKSKMTKWTFNKTISKICDSYRVDTGTKNRLRKMRR